MYSKKTLQRILLVPSVYFAGEIFHSQKDGPFSDSFVGSNSKTRFSSQAVNKKKHQNENPWEVFQLTKQKVLERLLNLPFLKDSTKRTGF